jgi:type IV pilus assembly protein PilA
MSIATEANTIDSARLASKYCNPLFSQWLTNGEQSWPRQQKCSILCASFCSCLGDVMKRQNGFSLIELLIVVAIILIIAAIAVPSYLRSRMAANEAAAVASVRTVNTAQISFNSAYPTVGFASTLTALAGTTCSPPDSTSACLIDTQLGGGQKSGYNFTLANVTGTPNATYSIIGAPVLVNGSGIRYFCSFQDGVVRYSMTSIGTCDNSVMPLQ